MINYDDTKIRLYETFIRDVLNSVIGKIDFSSLDSQGESFLSKMRERLCVEHEDAWIFITSCLDTIGDSQFAIVSYLNDEDSNHRKFAAGERYLRLYGVLNAVYIQQQAILKLVELFKIKDLKNLKNLFDQTDIIFLRHAISAHPINFNDNGSKKSFKVDRSSLTSNGKVTLLGHSNTIKHYDVFQSLRIYFGIAESMLHDSAAKLIKNLHGSEQNKLATLLEKLSLISNGR